MGEGIMHKIHTPSLVRPDRHRSGPAMQGHVFGAADAHPQLKPIEPIQAAHPLAINEASPHAVTTTQMR
jgi:hypothetical protein